MGGLHCNKHNLRWSSSYNQLKRSRFAVFRSLRERESGTVIFHVSLFSALAASSSGISVLLRTVFRVFDAIFGWCYELMNVWMKIRGPCQGPDIHSFGDNSFIKSTVEIVIIISNVKNCFINFSHVHFLYLLMGSNCCTLLSVPFLAHPAPSGNRVSYWDLWTLYSNVNIKMI